MPFTSLSKTANKPEEWKNPSNENVRGRGNAFLRILLMKMQMLLQQDPGMGAFSISSIASETFPPLRECQGSRIDPTTRCGWEWMFSNSSSNVAENQLGVQRGQGIWLLFILQNRTPTGSIFDRLPTKVQSAQWMMLSASHSNSKGLIFPGNDSQQ